MIDPQTNFALDAEENLNRGARSTLDARPETTFSPEVAPEFASEPNALPLSIIVRGAVWAEYHLMLAPPPQPDLFERIECERRIVGGAPRVARLLARHLRARGIEASVELPLELGEDPNARLARREIEKWNEPGLQMHSQVLLGAPEVPYRIVMWRGDSSIYEHAQVLQYGDVLGPNGLEVSFGGLKYLRLQPEALELEAGFAAWIDARLNGASESAAGDVEARAQAAWRALRFEDVVS